MASQILFYVTVWSAVANFAFSSYTKPDPVSCTKSDQIDDQCFEDGTGYTSCQPDEETYRTFTTIQCISPATKCECASGYLNGLIEWKPQKCRCVDPTPHPSFPSTGHLTWKGFEALMERDWWQDTIIDRKPRAVVGGEIYKDDAGRYLMEYTKVKDWWGNGYGAEDPAELGKEIKIIVPDGNGGFTKVTRSNDRKCKKESLQSHFEGFDFLWDHGIKDIWFADYYRKVGETPTANPSIKTQRWGGNYTYADFIFYTYSAECEFFVDYDETKGYAVPKKFRKKIDASDGADILVTDLEYDYKPLGGKSKEIKLDDYCNGDYDMVDPENDDLFATDDSFDPLY